MKSGIYSSYKSGKNYEKIFTNGDVIRLEFFLDDICTVSNFATNQSRHKILTMFFSINNFDYTLRTKEQNIYVSMVCPRKIIKKVGLRYVLKPFINEMNKLREKGIDIELNGDKHHFDIDICAFCGDNLAQHELLGINQRFSAGTICRFCYATFNEIQSKHSIKDFKSRTKENLKEDLIKNIKDPKLQKLNGVIREMPLTGLNNFNSLDVSVVDIMHDLQEGVLPKLNQLLISSISKSPKEFHKVKNFIKETKCNAFLSYSKKNSVEIKSNSSEVINCPQWLNCSVPIEAKRTEQFKLVLIFTIPLILIIFFRLWTYLLRYHHFY